mgnify:CR=1 FL=1
MVYGDTAMLLGSSPSTTVRTVAHKTRTRTNNCWYKTSTPYSFQYWHMTFA